MYYVDMLNAVLVRAKGCPEDEAADAMRNACMEFCEKTYFLTEGSQVVIDGTEVDLTDMDRQVLDVIEARVDDELILVTYMNDPDLDELASNRYPYTTNSRDYAYALTFADPNHAQLTAFGSNPAPSVDTPVTIDMILVYAPGPTSTEVPDLLWLRHSETLKSGALCRLLEEPGKAWSNPQLADYHRAKFMDAMTKAAADIGRNRQTTARRLRVRPA